MSNSLPARDTGAIDSGPPTSHDVPNVSVPPLAANSSTKKESSSVIERSVPAKISQEGHVDSSEISEASSALLQETPAAQASPSEKVSTPARRRRDHLLSWWLEFGSCLLSLVALVGMCVTLAAYRRKPSPEWPTGLSLNTIVAIFSVVFKTSILLVAAEGLGQLKWSWFTKDRSLIDLIGFDKASRGPRGALALLWSLRYQHLTASCGAMLVVLALAIDPLAQQTLNYYSCPVPLTTEQAHVPRTSYFYDFGAGHIAAGINTVSTGLQTSVTAGIFSPVSSVDYKCSTGNCTWTENYSTLGYCSKCEDISNSLSISNVTLNSSVSDWGIETSIPGGGLRIRSPAFAEFDLPFAKIGSSPALPKAGGAVIDFLVGKSVGETGPLRGHVTDSKCDSAGKQLAWQCKGYGAARCYIYPCVKTYAASMRAGIFSETLLGSADDWGDDEITNEQYAMIDTECITDDETRSLQSLGYTIKAGERWLPYHLTGWLPFDASVPLNLTHSFPQSMMRRNCMYAYNVLLDMSLSYWFTGQKPGAIFDGTVFGGGPSGDDGVYFGSQVAQAFYAFGNVEFDHVEALFKNATESLTKYMRENSEPALSVAAPGIVKQDKTCVNVRWPYLAFPAALLLLALLFLTLLAIDTRPGVNGPAIWKSSALALLYHGFASPAEIEQKIDAKADLDSIKGMETSAKTMVVHLQDSESHDAHLEVKKGVAGA